MNTKRFYAVFLGKDIKDIIYCDSDFNCLAIFKNKANAMEKKEEMKRLFPVSPYQVRTIKIERITRKKEV